MSALPAWMVWKNDLWWHMRQATADGVTARDQSDWRHHPTYRRRGHWEDALVRVFGFELIKLAMGKTWRTRLDEFREGAYEMVGVTDAPEGQKCEKKALLRNHVVRKVPRDVLLFFLPWRIPVGEGAVRIDVAGDSLLVINWCRGLWVVGVPSCRAAVGEWQCRPHSRCQLFLPVEDFGDLFRDVYRELNVRVGKVADDAAKSASHGFAIGCVLWPRYVQLHFDVCFKVGCWAGAVGLSGLLRTCWLVVIMLG